MSRKLLSLLLAFLSIFSIYSFADAEMLSDDTVYEEWSSDEVLSEEDEASLSQALSSGEYFIRNVGTNRYLDVENQNIANGAKLCQWRFKGRTSQKWTLSRGSDGYYTITLKKAGTKYYMGVQGDQTGNNVQIILRTGTVTNGMKWKITRTSQGHYKLTAKVSESVGRVLGVGADQANENGAYIKQRTYYDNTNYRDEWELIGKNGATLFASTGTYNSHYNEHTLIFPDVKDALTYMLFTPVKTKENATKIRFLELMASSKIIYFRGHGEQKCIHTSDKRQVAFGDILTLSSGALSDVKLVLYSACDAGKGRGKAPNMVNITHEMGAQTVIGFDKEQDCEEVNFWTKEFFIGLCDTRNIGKALRYAEKRAKEKFICGTSTENPYVVGNRGKLYSY